MKQDGDFEGTIIVGKQTISASIFLNGKEYLRTAICETEEEAREWASKTMKGVKELIGEDEFKRLNYDKQELRIYR